MRIFCVTCELENDEPRYFYEDSLDKLIECFNEKTDLVNAFLESNGEKPSYMHIEDFINLEDENIDIFEELDFTDMIYCTEIKIE